MSKLDSQRLINIETRLVRFSDEVLSLPGVSQPDRLNSLALQFVDSIHRVEYVRTIASRDVAAVRADPASDLFDPFKAAIHFRNHGNLDEACWLVFLATHFGKHGRTGWKLMRNIYGALGGARWSWESASLNPDAIAEWISTNYLGLTRSGAKGSFGNHRKYESIKPGSPASTGAVIASYVIWVRNSGGHAALFEYALRESDGDPRRAFRYLYTSMSAVRRFGRTGKFDFLTMLEKIGLASIEADSAYLWDSATGPLRGARLLFGGAVTADLSTGFLESKVVSLGQYLQVGMQEMEDALCNWQKSPIRFRRFKG